jgi:alkylation response protein AidB-like acyl-CoA dehydrogenase
MEAIKNKELVKGGEFLIKETNPMDIFIQEDFTEEQKMLAQTCKDFVAKEITPRVEELDYAKSPDLMSQMMTKIGELGLLGIGVPEQYNGFGMDFNSTMLAADYLGGGHAFAVAFSAHTGIGTLPIQYYGNEAQRAKYLPKLATGEWKACYCLTEPDSGSDANAAKTKATLTPDGKFYNITGQKMWITNGGFADVFIVFAKIDTDKNLTAFIIEKGTEGISMNEPEKKMGIKGSDTRQVFFTDCKVPVENMLSDRENGFKIAVNILNIGRIKLSASVNGGARTALNHAINYAQERKQFGVSINTFGAIRYKLAQSTVRIFATESANFRVGQNIEDAIQAYIAQGMDESKAKLKSFEQFAIECALMKVYGSESLDYVSDEAVQVYGGMGYSAESPVERCYRDSRINRIFEGTNEINRMLAVGTVLKRAMKGELNIMEPAMAVGKELMSVPDFATPDYGLFGAEKELIKGMKKAVLMIAGAAVQKFQAKFQTEQEIMMNLADMMIEVFVAESALLRAEKLISVRGENACQLEKDLALVNLHEAVDILNKAGRDAITSFATSDEQNVMLMGLRRFTKIAPFNSKEARERIAQVVIAKNEYPLAIV